MLWILTLSALGSIAALSQPEHNMTCEQFQRDAYFDPYEVADYMWKTFYFWAHSEITSVVFVLPRKQRNDKMKPEMDAVDSNLQLQWKRAVMLMEPRQNVTVVLPYSATPDSFRATMMEELYTEGKPSSLPMTKLCSDVRLKKKGPYIGMMCCETSSAYALARLDALPATAQSCHDEALQLGIHLPDGQAYSSARMADEL